MRTKFSKLLSILLCLVMALTLLPTVALAAGSGYQDTDGHWAETAIDRWSAYGVLEGDSGNFNPDGALTRAQMAAILSRLLNLPDAPDAGFSDVKPDDWFAEYINKCAAAGIMLGDNGKANPNEPITRQQAIVMIARALGIQPIENPDLTKYADAAQVSAYAQGYVAALIEAGIVGGVTADLLAPQANINRASTVTIFDRAIGTYANEAGETIKADGDGLILIVAKDVKLTDVPEGTRIVVADGAAGLTVNGKAVSDDQTYIVPETTTDTPSGGSSSGGSSSGGGHSHRYTYTDNGDGTHTGKCSSNDSTLDPAAHTYTDGKCTVCGAEAENKTASVKNTEGVIHYYDTLSAAIDAAGAGDTVYLLADVTFEGKITINNEKDILLDLNGHNIVSNDYYVFDVYNAKFHVTGTGSIFENVKNGYAPIIARGSNTDADNYTTITIDEGVTLKGDYAGIFVAKDADGKYMNYGLVINMNGTIDMGALKGQEGSVHGSGVYVNGRNTVTTGNVMQINLSGATIKNCVEAIYAAGYAKWSVKNCAMNAENAAIEIRAGEMTINGGTYEATAVPTSVDANGNGTTTSGAAIAVAQHTTKLPIDLTILSGEFKGYTALNQNNPENQANNDIVKVTVSGGVFTATQGGTNAVNSVNNTLSITGGTFSSDPTDYVAPGYTATKNDADMWEVACIFAGGSGTEENPFLISSANQLKAFRDSVNAGTTYSGKYIQLTTDINLNNEEWLPIGEKAGDKFSGTFDGHNHIIEGLSITATSGIGNEATFDGYAGFFGAINGGTVKNLSVYGSVSGKNVAGVVARVDGNSSVKNCHNHATVTSTNNAKAGGVICLTNAASITVQNCTNSGAVSGGTGGTAGIVAYANPGVTISGCSNTGNIGNASSTYAGGIVGYATKKNSSAGINDCTNSGAITASVSAGGIVGIATEAWTITNCNNSGAVSGTGSSGGIIGSVTNGTISSCSNTATVHGDQFAGGVVGTVASAAQIVKCSGGTSNITSSARTLTFTNGVVAALECTATTCAGRLIGTNQGGGPIVWASITIDGNNGDRYDEIGAIGICGNLTSWANIEIAGGTLHGTPAVGNQTYLRITENASWDDIEGRTPGTYTGTRIDGDTRPVWTLQTP